jgi:uncharacterized Fe-S cluster-containing radical SAM superfamily protein
MNAPAPAPPASVPELRRLDPAKFRDPLVTAKGERRAHVALARLDTLWLNTGSLCNLACTNCYIESSPTNDRLAYLSAEEAAAYLDEVARDGWPVKEIGFTGGEPFMNRDIIAMLADALDRGHRVLVLTNAMRPMMKVAEPLLALRRRHGARLALRVSLDHWGPEMHERERGPNSWAPAIAGLDWLAANGFAPRVASRLMWGESEAEARAGFRALFAARGLAIDADDPAALVLFPEMDARLDVPEITEACWGILGVSPDAMMCATSRMVVKRKGAEKPVVLPCTLLPYDAAFEMGTRLADAREPVALNHPHCARFCVLGGASCSRAE